MSDSFRHFTFLGELFLFLLLSRGDPTPELTTLDGMYDSLPVIEMLAEGDMISLNFFNLFFLCYSGLSVGFLGG